MRPIPYILAALAVASLGHPLEPTAASAAEPLTIEQMDKVTAGAFKLNFKHTGQFAFASSGSGCTAFRSVCTTPGSMATSTNGNVTTQYSGPAD